MKLRINFNIKNTLILFYLAKVRLEVKKFILTTSFVLLAPGKPRFYTLHYVFFRAFISCIILYLLYFIPVARLNKVMELIWNRRKISNFESEELLFHPCYTKFYPQFALFCTLYSFFVFSIQSGKKPPS